MTVTRSDVERIIDASLGATPAPRMDQVEEFVRKTLEYDFAATAPPFLSTPDPLVVFPSIVYTRPFSTFSTIPV